MRAYLDGMLRYFEISGRSSRSQYWLFFLVQLIITVAAVYGDFQLGGFDPKHPAPTLMIFASILHFIPGITVQFRRLHDIGRSGAWLLLYLVPFGGFVLLYWACLPSEGSNYYDGPAPSTYEPMTVRYNTIPQGVRMGSRTAAVVSGRSSKPPSEGRFI
ncbi:MAG TPA: DUF805 domain-containing protein [Devosia sp.]